MIELLHSAFIYMMITYQSGFYHFFNVVDAQNYLEAFILSKGIL